MNPVTGQATQVTATYAPHMSEFAITTVCIVIAAAFLLGSIIVAYWSESARERAARKAER